jgi:hypothetical protein
MNLVPTFRPPESDCLPHTPCSDNTDIHNDSLAGFQKRGIDEDSLPASGGLTRKEYLHAFLLMCSR